MITKITSIRYARSRAGAALPLRQKGPFYTLINILL